MDSDSDSDTRKCPTRMLQDRETTVIMRTVKMKITLFICKRQCACILYALYDIHIWRKCERTSWVKAQPNCSLFTFPSIFVYIVYYVMVVVYKLYCVHVYWIYVGVIKLKNIIERRQNATSDRTEIEDNIWAMILIDYKIMEFCTTI